jgi:hypothetical protein
MVVSVGENTITIAEEVLVLMGVGSKRQHIHNPRRSHGVIEVNEGVGRITDR